MIKVTGKSLTVNEMFPSDTSDYILFHLLKVDSNGVIARQLTYDDVRQLSSGVRWWWLQRCRSNGITIPDEVIKIIFKEELAETILRQAFRYLENRNPYNVGKFFDELDDKTLFRVFKRAGRFRTALARVFPLRLFPILMAERYKTEREYNYKSWLAVVEQRLKAGK